MKSKPVNDRFFYADPYQNVAFFGRLVFFPGFGAVDSRIHSSVCKTTRSNSVTGRLLSINLISNSVAACPISKAGCFMAVRPGSSNSTKMELVNPTRAIPCGIWMPADFSEVRHPMVRRSPAQNMASGLSFYCTRDLAASSVSA